MKNLMMLSILALLIANTSFSRDLVINSMHSDPDVKKAFQEVVDSFKKENPDINVTLNTTSHESYKVQIRTWLPNKAPDIATWFAGNRAKYFVDKGLIEPIDSVWAPVENEFSDSVKNVVKFNGKYYLLPISYYNWGFYYRKDIFEKAGVSKPPVSWEEFLETLKKVKASGVTPIAIGTRDGWPAAAWFDFLNMRINGYALHMELMDGKVSYADARVAKTFQVWQSLIEGSNFNKSASALSWQEATSLLWQGKASMYLMGNFITSQIPKDVANKIGFFAFPTIDPKVQRAEVAPVDVFFIPAKAKNKSEAKLFMAFLAKASTQEAFNRALNLIPTNKLAKVDSKGLFLKAGLETLSKAKNVSQFYDRDTDPEIAKAGMDGFVELMSNQKNLESIVSKIETARKRVHKN